MTGLGMFFSGVLCVAGAWADGSFAVSSMAEVSRLSSPSGGTEAILYVAREPVEEGLASGQMLRITGGDGAWDLRTPDAPFDWFGGYEFIDEERLLVTFKNATAERVYVCHIGTRERVLIGSGTPTLVRNGKNKGLIRLAGQKHLLPEGGAFWVDMLVDPEGQVVEVLSVYGLDGATVPLSRILDPALPHPKLRQPMDAAVPVLHHFEAVPPDGMWRATYADIVGHTHVEKSRNAYTTLEMEAVAEFSRWRAEQALAEAAERLYEALDTEGRELMLRSHAAWKEYARQQALFVTDGCRGGSARGLYSASIRRTETERRTKLYKELLAGKTPCTTGLSMYD